MQTNTRFKPQFPQAVHTRFDPSVIIVSLCAHPSSGPEVGGEGGVSISCCSIDEGLPSPSFPCPSEDGVVMPVEGSEDESKGEGTSSEAVDIERRVITGEEPASMAEGAGDENMLEPESESRLTRY